jgi:stage II sporulation protein D
VPASFHPEALKAQAVAARTYTLRCVLSGNKHQQGAVCTDHRCCQAYCEPEEYLSSGGKEEGLKKIRAAVEETCGEVLYYGSELICATYFASSGGTTEDAKAVWGQSYPYLLSVSSPEEASGDHGQQVTFTPDELQERLGVTLTGTPKSWFGMVAYTQGKGVALMRIGARLYTGVQLRKLLELRSTVISVDIQDQQIVFTTRGYGHRVGMSQHGANAMAKNGQDYRAILLHYYHNVTIDRFQYNNH